MTMEEAMKKRHTVRKYLDKPLPADVINLLNSRIEENNRRYNLAIKLHTNDSSAFGVVIKLVLAKGVRNYFVLAGPDTDNLDEKLGYSSADLMLYAQTLGLNTWWVGGTFNRRKVNAKAGEHKAIGVVAVGYGATEGVPHKSKVYEDIAAYEGETPEWFYRGVEAALLAPTALNRQAFHVLGMGDAVNITCDNGVFSGADLGIVKYHFELGAGAGNFYWDHAERTVCETCRGIKLYDSFPSPSVYFECLEYIKGLLGSGKYEMAEQTCKIEEVMKNDTWPDDVVTHVIRCRTCGQRYSCTAITYKGQGSFQKGEH